jgi:aminopeptidase YwaD
MIRKVCIAAILLIVFGLGSIAQNSKYNQSDSAVAARLKKDVSVLASDSLEGREAGTDGEAMAKQYIEGQFKEIGLKPLFSDNASYFQPFDVTGGAGYNSNLLSINGGSFQFNEDFYPLDCSANAEVKGEIVKVGYGIVAPELKYDDYKKLSDIKDKIVVMKMYLSDSLLKISGFSDYTDPKVRIKSAIEKGASAVIFITSDPDELGPSKTLSGNTKPLSIPCIYAAKKAAKLIKVATNMKAELEVNVKREKCKTAYNVGGYIDNKAKYTVVIGAHYDHLGYTTSSTGKKNVCNGADDNGSGTAAMMELARYFSDTTKERYNLVFLAFSAEEKGLYGSQYFVESNAIDLSKVAFMMNCDMIGRLDSTKKLLTIYSIGSSPAWKKIVASTDSAGLKINAKEAAESGSDHYSFYEKNIPDVFFFTDLHADYHKPTDDIWKVNFQGEAQIVKYIERFFNAVKGNKKLPFSRTISYW